MKQSDGLPAQAPGQPVAFEDIVPPAEGEGPVGQIRLHEEELSVSRRKVETSTVRVATVTHTNDHLVDEERVTEEVDVERVAIGRYVEAVPPVRQEGDLTIISIVEEVIERRLLLREEVHIRRVRTTEHHVETVKLRRQEAVITRTPHERQSDPDGTTSNLLETEQ